MTADDAIPGPPRSGADRAAALGALGLPEMEEAIGELHRRAAVALRALGERGADRPDAGGRTPRREAAGLAASLELAALALAARAAGGAEPGGDGPPAPGDGRREALADGLMYAAPTIPALLQRLEQDRRLLASLARGAGDGRALRRLLAEAALGASARCAMALERRAAQDRG